MRFTSKYAELVVFEAKDPKASTQILILRDALIHVRKKKAIKITRLCKNRLGQINTVL